MAAGIGGSGPASLGAVVLFSDGLHPDIKLSDLRGGGVSEELREKYALSDEKVGQMLSQVDTTLLGKLRLAATALWDSFTKPAPPSLNPQIENCYIFFARGKKEKAGESLAQLQAFDPRRFEEILGHVQSVFPHMTESELLEDPTPLFTLQDSNKEILIDSLLYSRPVIGPLSEVSSPKTLVKNLQALYKKREDQFLRSATRYPLLLNWLAMNDLESFMEHFEKFRMGLRLDARDLANKDTPALHRLAFFLASVPEFNIHYCISVGKIPDERVRYELFKIGSKRRGVAEYNDLVVYNISDPEIHLEIANHLASLPRSPMTASLSLMMTRRGFYIAKEEDRVRLAFLCARKEPDRFVFAVDHFQISDPKQRLELATICAESAPGKLPPHIKKFSVDSQEERFKLVKICLEKDPESLPSYLRELGLDSTQREELFQIYREKYPHILIEHIGCFDLPSAELVRILNEFIPTHTSAIVRCIRYFTLSPEDHARILRDYADKVAGDIAANIYNFDLKLLTIDEKFTLAKRCAQHNAASTMHYLASFELEEATSEMNFELASLCAQGEPSLFALKFNDFHISNKEMHFELACIAVHADGQGFSLYRILRNGALWGIDGDRKEEKLHRLFTLEAEAYLREHHLTIPSRYIFEKLIPQLAKYRGAPAHALYMLEIALSMAKEDKFEETCAQLTEAGVHSYTLMTAIAKWSLAGPHEGEEASSGDIEEAQREIKAVVQLARKEFKNAATKLADTWTKLSASLNVCEELSASQKLHLFALVCRKVEKNEGETARNYQKRLTGILMFRLAAINLLLKFEDFETLSKARDPEELTRAVGNFIEKLALPIPATEEAVTDFLETLGETRHPFAFLIYTDKMRGLREPLVDEMLNAMTLSVLDRSYQRARYSLENNPHLRVIHERDPEILAKWSAPTPPRCALDFAPTGIEAIGELNMQEFFADKLEHRHFDPAVFPALTAAIQAESIEEKRQIFEGLELEEGASQERVVERLCLELLITPPDDKSVDRLMALRGAMGKLDVKPELFNDICGLQGQLTEKSSLDEKFTVVDTDDWEDLLLAGTEVSGSCQSVEGSPSLNKCLLDYIMNGRNRMIAIKDPHGKIIARRIFRILWDERQRKPVLFMERTYSNYLDPKIDRILTNYAKERAQALGLPLLSTVDNGEAYPNEIKGLPGPSPWGYCDSALRGEFAGVYENAEFTIASPNIIDTSL